MRPTSHYINPFNLDALLGAIQPNRTWQFQEIPVPAADVSVEAPAARELTTEVVFADLGRDFSNREEN